MDVKIKDTSDVEMTVKNNGIEFEIRRPRGKERLGDLRLTKTKLIWSPGQTSKNVYEVKWEKFIQWIESQ